MTFQLGDPKPPGSGRKPGSPNQLTRDLRTMAEAEADNTPIPVLLVRLGLQYEAEDDRDHAISCLIAAAGMLYPKLKSIEIPEQPAPLPMMIIQGPAPIDIDWRPPATDLTKL